MTFAPRVLVAAPALLALAGCSGIPPRRHRLAAIDGNGHQSVTTKDLGI